jgi:hypothetical protein
MFSTRAAARKATAGQGQHLVGAGDQRRRHSQSEGFRCLEVDHQFKLCRLYNRQLSGFGPFEDLRD